MNQEEQKPEAPSNVLQADFTPPADMPADTPADITPSPLPEIADATAAVPAQATQPIPQTSQYPCPKCGHYNLIVDKTAKDKKQQCKCSVCAWADDYVTVMAIYATHVVELTRPIMNIPDVIMQESARQISKEAKQNNIANNKQQRLQNKLAIEFINFVRKTKMILSGFEKRQKKINDMTPKAEANNEVKASELATEAESKAPEADPSNPDAE